MMSLQLFGLLSILLIIDARSIGYAEPKKDEPEDEPVEFESISEYGNDEPEDEPVEFDLISEYGNVTTKATVATKPEVTTKATVQTKPEVTTKATVQTKPEVTTKAPVPTKPEDSLCGFHANGEAEDIHEDPSCCEKYKCWGGVVKTCPNGTYYQQKKCVGDSANCGIRPTSCSSGQGNSLCGFDSNGRAIAIYDDPSCCEKFKCSGNVVKSCPNGTYYQQKKCVRDSAICGSRPTSCSSGQGITTKAPVPTKHEVSTEATVPTTPEVTTKATVSTKPEVTMEVTVPTEAEVTTKAPVPTKSEVTTEAPVPTTPEDSLCGFHSNGQAKDIHEDPSCCEKFKCWGDLVKTCPNGTYYQQKKCVGDSAKCGSRPTSCSSGQGITTKATVPTKPAVTTKVTVPTKPEVTTKATVPTRPEVTTKATVPTEPEVTTKATVPTKPAECDDDKVMKNNMCVPAQVVRISLTTAGTFTADLENRQSKKFKERALEVENIFNKRLLEKNIQAHARVLSFTKGSIIANVGIMFDNDTTLNSSTVALVGNTIQEAVKTGKFESLGVKKNISITIKAEYKVTEEECAPSLRIRTMAACKNAIPFVTQKAKVSFQNVNVSDGNAYPRGCSKGKNDEIRFNSHGQCKKKVDHICLNAEGNNRRSEDKCPQGQKIMDAFTCNPSASSGVFDGERVSKKDGNLYPTGCSYDENKVVYYYNKYGKESHICMTQSPSKAGETAATCKNSVGDIGFIIDSSYSVGGEYGSINQGWQKNKNLVKKLAKAMQISRSGIHVSLIDFSETATLSIKFNQATDSASFNQLVDGAEYFGRTTRIDLALELALTDMFIEKNGARPGVQKVLVVITDGSQTYRQLIKKKVNPNQFADRVRGSCIKIIAVGVPDFQGEISKNELLAIAGDQKYVFTKDTFEQILAGDFIHSIADEAC